MTKNLLMNPYFKVLLFLFLYYLMGLIFFFGLTIFQKEKWIQKSESFFQIVLPNLLKALLISLFAGFLFIWIPTMFVMLPSSFASKAFSFLSSFSFSIVVSAIQGWLFIKGFDVIKKHQAPLKIEKSFEKSVNNFVQPIIFFLGFMLLLSILLDFFLSFLVFHLTTEYLFVKLVKLSCTLKI